MISVKQKSAIVTGAGGQDGTYLTRDLLEAGYKVYGILRPGQEMSKQKVLNTHDSPALEIVNLDILNFNSISTILKEIAPDEFYNLASHSIVSDCEDNPIATAMVTGVATVNILEAIKVYSPKTRFLQAGSSEIFGDTLAFPQNENSNFAPRNIYGTSKLMAHWATNKSQISHGLFCSNVILYNHESPLRSPAFVTRAITNAVAKIKLGEEKDLKIGNLSAERDWGFAPEYVQGMRQILAHPKPDTFILATGVCTTVREFVKISFAAAGLEVEFTGEHLNEMGFDVATGRQVVSVSPEKFREKEPVALIGDSSKAELALGWKDQTQVAEIAQIMVEEDIESLSSHQA